MNKNPDENVNKKEKNKKDGERGKKEIMLKKKQKKFVIRKEGQGKYWWN